MKAAIYNPYLDTLGGGERYSISFAKVLSDSGYEVDVEWNNKHIRKNLQDRFGIDLCDIRIVNSINRGDQYDVCFWVSDGSVPRLRARNNILHFQFPFRDVDGKSLLNRMKMFRVNAVLVNSKFTKGFIDDEYGVDSKVVYPPVDVKKFKAKRKEKIILYVGRFSKLTQNKGQDNLIKTYKTLVKEGYSDWKLVLAGGAEVGSDKYLKKLKKDAKKYPVTFVENPSLKKLQELYGKAKIFWSAAGYGIHEQKQPLKVEHFGITPVEAMSAGCIVFLYEAGGHKEIVFDQKDGYLWEKTEELIDKTVKVIENYKLSQKLARNAKKKAQIFSYENFEKEIKNLL
ncbi:glycosyltransferase family 4 protein [Candidatus Woesebacteria bacterium]|nr:glycosyltransferase family 4 protein [Candidatus Woesebacteria bacterium]